MRQTQLGTTGIRIPVLAQGTTGAGARATASQESINARIDLIRQGVDLGVTLIDTADDYEAGHAEEITGRAIRGLRDRVFLCTKFGAKDATRIGVRRALEASLRRLGVEHVDLYQIHWPNTSVPVTETMAALEGLVAEGKVRFIGACNFSLPEVLHVEQVLAENALVSVQAEFNTVNRMIEKDLLPFCQSRGKTLLSYSVFSQGQLHVGRVRAAVLDIARSHGLSLHQLVLAWALSRDRLVPITRTMNLKHLWANVEATGTRLEPAVVNELDRLLGVNPVLVETDSIAVRSFDVDETHVIYTTLEDAVRNSSGLRPSPTDLAQELLDGRPMRPVELLRRTVGSTRFELLHGRVRYWAWRIAYGDTKPIPAFVLE